MSDIVVTGLFIHPIKACRAVAVSRATLDPRGFVDDRRFMLVDSTGRFLTQREEPRLARVSPELAAERLVLRAPDAEPLSVPRSPPAGERLTVTVWRSEVPAVVIPEAGTWFSKWLGRDVKLVYMPDDADRRTPDGAPVSFADGYPLLLTNEQSLSALEAKHGASLQMERFRPNIVVGNTAPFTEEQWTTLTIGGQQFRHTLPCERCIVIDVDPVRGERHGSALLKDLVALRGTGEATFGINLVHEESGEIALGDRVTPVLTQSGGEA